MNSKTYAKRTEHATMFTFAIPCFIAGVAFALLFATGCKDTPAGYAPFAVVTGETHVTNLIKRTNTVSSNEGDSTPSYDVFEVSDTQLDDSGWYETVGNNDDYANTNETLRLSVEIHNIFSNDVDAVSAYLSTSSWYVTVDESSKTYGDVDADEYSEPGDTFSSAFTGITSVDDDAFLITIDEDCPHEEEVTFSLRLTYNGGYTETVSFDITIYHESPWW